jgi:hypothetical protein
LVLRSIKKQACFTLEIIAMKLMMYIGNDLIEAVQLDDKKIPKPGYLGSFKRNLKLKYQELIQQFPDPPEFLVVNPQPPRFQTSSIY